MCTHKCTNFTTTKVDTSIYLSDLCKCLSCELYTHVFIIKSFLIMCTYSILAELNDIRYSAYRTAMKLRTVQKKICCKC